MGLDTSNFVVVGYDNWMGLPIYGPPTSTLPPNTSSSIPNASYSASGDLIGSGGGGPATLAHVGDSGVGVNPGVQVATTNPPTGRINVNTGFSAPSPPPLPAPAPSTSPHPAPATGNYVFTGQYGTWTQAQKDAYLAANPDVAQAGIDAQQHYEQSGADENRQGFPTLLGGAGGSTGDLISDMDFSFMTGPLSGNSGFNALRSSLTPMTKYFTESQKRLAGLPSEIDTWTTDLNNQYRIGRDETWETLNDVASARSAKGILGGTETQNLRAKAMSDLVEKADSAKRENLKDAIEQKVRTIAGTAETSAIPVELLAETYGLEAKENMNWDSLLMQLISGGL